MIGYLEGHVQSKLRDGVLLLTSGGVGYQVFLPLPLLTGLPASGSEIKLFISTIVRETEISLYGFSDRAGKSLFELLITVSGVGPKAALGFLSAFTPKVIISAIIREDVALLTTIPGIGKKTATRLCIELSDKMAKHEGGPDETPSEFQGELRSALTNLGFQEKDVLIVLQKIPPGSESFSDQLKQALTLLGKN